MPPVPLLAALAGAGLAGLVAAAAWAYRAAPVRRCCPECTAPTEPVQAPAILGPLRPLFVVRWCPACGWEGLARRGPWWEPGDPVAHRSGFRWGRARLPTDFGFRWSSRRDPARHPSGFRFGPDPR